MWTKIVMSTINAMPRWVRIVAFFVALAVATYLALIPQFVSGFVFFKDEAGGKWAYRGGEIVVSVGGRDYKYTVNENGYFSVPMISKLPQDLRLGFIHKDTGGRYDVIVPFKKMATAIDLDFEVKSAPPSVILVAEADGPGLVERVASRMIARGFPELVAAELQLPDNVQAIPKPAAAEVKKEIVDIVAREANKPAESLKATTEFTWANGFPYIVKIRVVDTIEKTYGFRIPDDHWQSFRSVGEVVDYTQKRIALDKVNPSKGISWPEYQNKVQSQGGPLFVK